MNQQYNYVTENKETSFKFTFKPSAMFIVFAYCKHLKLPINIRIPVTICLKDLGQS